MVGTGVVGCLIAEQALDAGLSVLMLEAGPRVDRSRIVENFRNLPPSLRLYHWDAPYPPKPWAPHLETRGAKEQEQYLQVEGPNARAYLQGYVRYAGGATWHWAGLCWRITPEDMRLKSLYGVGRDWPFGYDVHRALLHARRICDRRVRSIRPGIAMARQYKTLQTLPDGANTLRSRRAPSHRGGGETRDDQRAGAAGTQQRRLL